MISNLALFDAVPIGILLCDRYLVVQVWNSCLEHWTGFKRSEIIGNKLSIHFPRFAEKRYTSRLETLFQDGAPVIFSYQINGSLFPHKTNAQMGKVQHITATSYQVNTEDYILIAVEDRSEVSNRIKTARAALEEKEFLMREINHRVKNNLNMILSIINLQRDRAGSEKVLHILDDLDGRIRSFATLHEVLYRGDRVDAVQADEYLKNVLEDLFESLRKPGSEARLILDMDSFYLKAKTALYIALIAVEAITNSIKYAFNGRSDGKVELHLKKSHQESFLLYIQDDGPGFPPSFDYKSGESLGLKLAELLTEELGGTFLLGTEGGAYLKAQFSSGIV
ncbi:hypothetical protein MASR2M78_27390 [Treponema sp.]